VIIEDFPEDDPWERPDPGWRAPFAKPDLDGASATRLADVLEDESARVEKLHRRAAEELGRTILGLSGLSIGEAGRYMAGWLRGTIPESPSPEMSAPLTLRFAVERPISKSPSPAPPSRRASSSATGYGTTPRPARRSSPCAART
jgi:hypothetical protein